MPPTHAELLKLPATERAEIALSLWESLEEGLQGRHFELTAEWAEELERRMREHEADPSTAIPWEETRRALFRKE